LCIDAVGTDFAGCIYGGCGGDRASRIHDVAARQHQLHKRLRVVQQLLDLKRDSKAHIQ
jgi:hypothetical protein